MIQIQNLYQLTDSIHTGEPVLIYFSGKNCSVCKVLKPKIEAAVSSEFPNFKLLEVESESHPEITIHFSVFPVPVILIFFDKKEFYRRNGNLSVQAFIEELRRPYNLMMG